MENLWSADYFRQQQLKRVAKMKPQDFEIWDEARERFLEKKLQPLLDLYRQSDHDAFKDFNRRKGEVLHSSDLIFRLQNLNPHIFVQNQINFPDDWGLYTDSLGRIQFLTGLPKGYLTEFSWAIVDDRDLPLEERRGWRTVLVYCMNKGALTWDDVFREFGDPQDGFNDARWHLATDSLRHGSDQVSQRNCNNL